MLRLVLEKLGVTDEFSGPHCEWEGVMCDEEEQCAQILDFANRNLTGDLPAELGYLSSLTHLWFGDNPKLRGSFQPLKPLKSLIALDMDNSQVTGCLEDLQHLKHLEHLTLRKAQVGGYLEALRDLTNIVRLDLSATQVSGRLDALRDLKNMTQVLLHGTGITGQFLGHCWQRFLILICIATSHSVEIYLDKAVLAMVISQNPVPNQAQKTLGLGLGFCRKT